MSKDEQHITSHSAAETWKDDLETSYSGSKGLLSFHHGPQVEDPTKAWDKLDSFTKVVDEPRQQQGIETFQLAVNGNAKLQLFDTGTSDVSNISGAKTTEITVVNLKEGKTKTDLENFLQDVKEETFLIVMGWDSMEDLSVKNVPAYNALTSGPDFPIVVQSMHHAKLTAVEL